MRQHRAACARGHASVSLRDRRATHRRAAFRAVRRFALAPSLEPKQLAERPLRVARAGEPGGESHRDRSTEWLSLRRSQVRSQQCGRVPNGNRVVPGEARPGPAQPRLTLHPGALAGERNENRSAVRRYLLRNLGDRKVAKRCVRVAPRAYQTYTTAWVASRAAVEWIAELS